MGFLRLFNRYILRDLLRRPLRALLTLAGVSLGLAVVVSVHLAGERAVGSFTESLKILSGPADLQITAGGLPLDEKVITRLRRLSSRASLSAVIEGRATLPDGSSVEILGVDLLSDGPFRRYLLPGGEDLEEGLTRETFLDLLADPERVIVPAALAGRLGLFEGSRLSLLIRDQRRDFVVGAVLEQEGAARAFGGNLIVMDIAAAQLALQRFGTLDRIDVLVHRREDVEAVARRLVEELPEPLVVSRPEERTEQSRRMLRAFRFNLSALSYIALLVGIILVYNTLNLAVVRRHSEIGVLRALGTRRRTVLALFLGEAVLFGFAGSLLGIWFGELMAAAAGELVSGTVQSLYTGVSLVPFHGDAGTGFYLGVILLGVFLGAGSGLLPALRATRVSPAGTLRTGALAAPRRRLLHARTAGGFILLAAGAVLSLGPPVGGVPVSGYLASLSFIAGAGCLAPLLARLLLRPGEALLRRLFPVEGVLAARSVRGGLFRVAAAVISLMVAVAMLVSVATMVASFRQTVVLWLDQILQADLFIRAAGAGSNDWSNPLSPETVAAVQDLPGLAAVDHLQGRVVQFRGWPVTLTAVDLEVVAQHGNLALTGRRDVAATVRELLIGTDRVLVSEPLALRHGLRTGERIPLPTPAGERPFEVTGIYYDYSSDRGVVMMDRQVYEKHFGDQAVHRMALYLAPGIEPDGVRARLAGLPGIHLRVYSNRELKGQALRIFDQTFRVTYALEVIAILVAILGITNTLAALILERRTEIGVLRFLGAAPSQVRRTVLLESGLVGVLGCALGFALGLVLSLLLIYVINRQSFGWTIQFFLPLEFLAAALALVFAFTLAAGVYPAALAARTDPLRAVRAE